MLKLDTIPEVRHYTKEEEEEKISLIPFYVIHGG